MNIRATPVAVAKIRNPLKSVKRIKTATLKRKPLQKLPYLNKTKTMRKRHMKRNRIVQNEMQKGTFHFVS